MTECNFNKIMLVSLCDKWTPEVGVRLSQILGMLFCDIDELMEYELIDKKSIELFCTKEYLNDREKKVLKHYSTFENVVSSISFDYFIHNIKYLGTNNLIVFLNVPKNFAKEQLNSVDLIAFDDRKKKLEESAHLCINLRKTDIDFVCDKIISTLRGIL